MAKPATAPKDGLVRWPDGRARRVRAGGVIPPGATFEEIDAEASAPKAAKSKAKETTKAAGPSETTEG